MKGLESLIKTINKELQTTQDCHSLNIAKTIDGYEDYLKGKEEAYNLVLCLLSEFKKLNEDSD